MIRRYGTAIARSDRSAYSSIVRRRASCAHEESLPASTTIAHSYHEPIRRSATDSLDDPAGVMPEVGGPRHRGGKVDREFVRAVLLVAQPEPRLTGHLVADELDAVG